MFVFFRRRARRVVWLCTTSLLLIYTSSVCADAGNETANAITLPQVLARVLRDSPELATFPYRLRAAEAQTLQASLHPNPELSFSIENFAGDAEFSGTDSAEMTLALSQVIELGGKRRFRKQAARFGTELVEYDYELARLDVLSRSAGRFLDVIRAQYLLELVQTADRWTQRAEQVAQARFQAGGISRAELSQARIETLRSGLMVTDAQNTLHIAGLQLAAEWGAEQVDFTIARADLFSVYSTPPFTRLREQLDQSPQLQRYLTLDRLRQAELDLAIANGRQDISVGLGLRRFEDIGEQALTFEVSMPLGIANRNQGGIDAARAELERIGSEHKVSRTGLYTELHRLYRQMQHSHRVVSVLRQDALPEANRALTQVEQGYRNGRFSYLELVEARRMRLSVERDMIDVATVFHRTLITLEQLTGEAIAQGPDSIIQARKTTTDSSQGDSK